MRLVLSVLVIGSLLGCNEELTPRDHYEAPFSVYGVLTPQRDTQSVRVYALEDFPTLGSPEPLDAELTSTDMMTGEMVAWTQTVTREPNGQYGYLFHAPFRAEYGHRYRVEVERSDGAMSFAEVRVPPEVRVGLVDPDDRNPRVRIEGAGIRALTPEVEYVVQAAASSLAPVLSYKLPLQAEPIETGWEARISMNVNRQRVQSWYNQDAQVFTGIICEAIRLLQLKLHVIVADTVWNPPDGEFDPEILSQPGTLDNVENGFGFIGGGYRIDIPLRPSQEGVESACYAFDSNLGIP